MYRKSSLGRNQRSSAAVGQWNCSRVLVILVITHSFLLIQQVYTRTDVTYSSSLFRFSFLQRWLRCTVLFISRYLSLKPVCFQTHELIVTATNFFFVNLSLATMRICGLRLREFSKLEEKFTPHYCMRNAYSWTSRWFQFFKEISRLSAKRYRIKWKYYRSNSMDLCFIKFVGIRA